MDKKKEMTKEKGNLTRRYLLWCYKTTKEELDRIDRYFAQVEVDYYVLELLSDEKSAQGTCDDKQYVKSVDEFKKYISNKVDMVYPKKFVDKEGEKLQPDYLYLRNRLTAIEKAICKFFGEDELSNIQALYEEEMMQRILSAREH